MCKFLLALCRFGNLKMFWMRNLHKWSIQVFSIFSKIFVQEIFVLWKWWNYIAACGSESIVCAISLLLLWCVEEGDDDPGVGDQLDPYELLPAVNILSQLPADFEENIVCVHVCVCVCMRMCMCCQYEVTVVLCWLVDSLKFVAVWLVHCKVKFLNRTHCHEFFPAKHATHTIRIYKCAYK